jgi:hypothetical protein
MDSFSEGSNGAGTLPARQPTQNQGNYSISSGWTLLQAQFVNEVNTPDPKLPIGFTLT